jgi:hypothetical protein
MWIKLKLKSNLTSLIQKSYEPRVTSFNLFHLFVKIAISYQTPPTTDSDMPLKFNQYKFSHLNHLQLQIKQCLLVARLDGWD